jgi:hypothetical protein
LGLAVLIIGVFLVVDVGVSFSVGPIRLPLLASSDSLHEPIPSDGLAQARRQSTAAIDAILFKPFSPSSPWNTPIPPGAQFTPTGTFAGDPGWVNSDQSSFPVFFTDPSYPTVTFTSPQASYSLPVPPSVAPAKGSDANITVVDLGAGVSIDFFNASRSGSSSFSAALSIQTPLSGSGFGTGSGNQVEKAGVRASGASTLGGMITGPNIAGGVIDHALAVAVGNKNLYAAYVAPAVAIDQGGGSTYSGPLPMGTRLGIPRGTPKPPLSPIGSMVWDAFARYGGFVLDRADSFALYAEPNTVSPGQVGPLNNSDLRKVVAALQVVSG